MLDFRDKNFATPCNTEKEDLRSLGLLVLVVRTDLSGGRLDGGHYCGLDFGWVGYWWT
jgi:hypothetical protein